MVHKQFFKQLLSRHWQLPALCLLLTAELATGKATPVLAFGLEKSAPLSSAQVDGTKTVAFSTGSAASDSMPDGVYLYGQSSTPEQIGKEYLIFEVRSGKIIGAVYMPASEFNCFHGTLNSEQLNLTLVNPEDNTSYSYSIALQKTTQIAEAGGRITSPSSVSLEGYHRIDTVSESNKQLLTSCKASH